MDQKQRIARIRGVVRQACKRAGIKALSVRNGRGTAWGWLEVWADSDGSCFNDQQTAVLDSLGIGYCANIANMSPQDVRRWAAEGSG